MRIFKIIVYAALIIFHLTAIILISVGRNNFDFLLNLFNKLDWMMYGAYLGLVLFAITILFDFLNQKSIATLNKKHQDEINELKAKLYDKKEGEGEPKEVTPASPIKKTSDKKEDESSSKDEDTDKKVD